MPNKDAQQQKSAATLHGEEHSDPPPQRFQLIYRIEACPQPIQPHSEPLTTTTTTLRCDSSSTINDLPPGPRKNSYDDEGSSYPFPITPAPATPAVPAPLRANSYGPVHRRSGTPLNPSATAAAAAAVGSPGQVYEHLVCPLCFTLPQRIKRLPCCLKRVCAECSAEWINEHGTCPFCRADVEQVLNDAAQEHNSHHEHPTENNIISNQATNNALAVPSVVPSGQHPSGHSIASHPQPEQEHQESEQPVPRRRKRHRVELPDDVEACAMLDDIEVLCPLRTAHESNEWVGGCTWVGPRAQVRRHIVDDCPGAVDPSTGKRSRKLDRIEFIGWDTTDDKFIPDDSDSDEDDQPLHHTILHIDVDGLPISILRAAQEPSPYSLQLIEPDPPRYWWQTRSCSGAFWAMFLMCLLVGFIVYMVFGTTRSAEVGPLPPQLGTNNAANIPTTGTSATRYMAGRLAAAAFPTPPPPAPPFIP
ncbi:hypothetical protein DFS34DRAFT_618637 [Phlyctochytrium arcticum]|nr:hypothetical protein DFS34DRAFT_618637 [Phlyctochytrium arcticum]